MGKIILKRFSKPTHSTPKTYTVKRKTFGVIGDAASGIGNAANKVVGTAENITGSVAEGAGNVANSFLGKTAGAMAGAAATAPVLSTALGGGVGGALGAAALGPLALPVMAAGGWLAAKYGGKLLKRIGGGLKEDAANRTA